MCRTPTNPALTISSDLFPCSIPDLVRPPRSAFPCLSPIGLAGCSPTSRIFRSRCAPQTRRSRSRSATSTWKSSKAGGGRCWLRPSRRQQLLALGPVERFVECTTKLVEQFVDLCRPDDQRRADRDHVARDETHDQSFGLRVRDHSRTEAALRIEWLLAGLVRREFDRTDQSHTARLADERVIAERHQALLELRG